MRIDFEVLRNLEREACMDIARAAAFQLDGLEMSDMTRLEQRIAEELVNHGVLIEHED